MKTALELLGDDDCRKHSNFCECDIELVAKRAREEMQDDAKNIAIAHGAWKVADAIRALPVTKP